MSRTYQEGEIVEFQRQATWGPGKIVHISGDHLHILFRDDGGREARVFMRDAPGLRLAADQNDAILSLLPPLKQQGNRWVLSKERISFATATEIFLRHFPGGFADVKYTQIERKGKDEAHRRLGERLNLQQFRLLLEADDLQALTNEILSAKSPASEILSVFENVAFKEAIQHQDAARKFFSTLLTVMESPEITADVIEPYFEAVSSLPARRARVASWPIATLFPHIAQPERHMLLKPEHTRKAADILAFDLQYSPNLNWSTYAALLRMSRTYLDKLQSLGARDFVDVQSFIFVAGGGYDT